MAAAQSSEYAGNLGLIVDQVAQEKGIDKGVLVETMEAAILKAAQAAFGPTRELEAQYNDETGSIDLFQYMRVVEHVSEPEREISADLARKHGLEADLGEELGFQVFWHPRDAEKARQQDKEFGSVLDMKQARSSFGRIAAQTAKQVLLQRVRDAERELIYNQFKDRKCQLIRGIIRRFERGHNVIVDLGQTEGVLPYREQTPRETYRPGDRIVAYVKDIDREARGPLVSTSLEFPIGAGGVTYDLPMLLPGAEHTELFVVPTQRRGVIDVHDLVARPARLVADLVVARPVAHALHGPPQPVLGQSVYRFDLGGEGSDIFIVPLGQTAAAMRYEAIFY